MEIDARSAMETAYEEKHVHTCLDLQPRQRSFKTYNGINSIRDSCGIDIQHTNPYKPIHSHTYPPPSLPSLSLPHLPPCDAVFNGNNNAGGERRLDDLI